MKHLGDITKINGYTAPPVDVIVGGSPCQDLSVAGKRAGLDGERSGLFMEQIRIIKEMRRNDENNGRTDINIRPRYMVWENVVGAFSSNNGEDFRVVLEETAKIVDKNAHIPRYEKWPTAGCILAERYSLAWRVMDSQYWGVPQRRRRIALVADFGGQSAPKILFERESVSGYTEPCGTKGKGIAGDASDCTEANDRPSVSFQERAGKPGGGKGILIQDDHTGALSTDPNQFVVDKKIPFVDGWGGNMEKMFVDDKMNTVRSAQPQVVVKDTAITVDMGGGKSACNILEDQSPTLTCTHYGEPAVAHEDRSNCYTCKPGMMLRFNNKMDKDLSVTIDTAGGGQSNNDSI